MWSGAIDEESSYSGAARRVAVVLCKEFRVRLEERLLESLAVVARLVAVEGGEGDVKAFGSELGRFRAWRDKSSCELGAMRMEH